MRQKSKQRERQRDVDGQKDRQRGREMDLPRFISGFNYTETASIK